MIIQRKSEVLSSNHQQFQWPQVVIKDKMNNKPVLGVQLTGEFTDHLKSIKAKYKQVNIHYADAVLTLCAFDGAMMRQGSHKIVNIITYTYSTSVSFPKCCRMPDSLQLIVLLY